jgi:hypothetical protein
MKAFNRECDNVTSILIIQQTASHVCRGTNNYFVVVLSVSLSLFLLQRLALMHFAGKLPPFLNNSSI